LISSMSRNSGIIVLRRENRPARRRRQVPPRVASGRRECALSRLDDVEPPGLASPGRAQDP
jgi:hypothetical protein